MVDFIACMLLFALFLLGFYYERKKKQRKEHEEWLYFCQKRLHKIALQFRDDCMAATKEVMTQYTAFLTWKTYRFGSATFLSDYSKTIERLAEEYTVNYAEKYSKGDNRLRCEVEDLPNYILDEYRAEVSEIAKTFRDFEHLMWENIHELKKK